MGQKSDNMGFMGHRENVTCMFQKLYKSEEHVTISIITIQVAA